MPVCDLQAPSCLLQALRRQITALEAQKKDLKGGMAKVKASCEQKASENEALRAQIKVIGAVTGMYSLTTIGQHFLMLIVAES